MSLRTINAPAPLSNNILIVCALEFRISSEVSRLFWVFINLLPRGFGGKITPKVIGDKFVALKNCSLFEINLVYVGLQDEV